jgi:hypothetical protein
MRYGVIGLILAAATTLAACASHRDQPGPVAGNAPELASRFEAASAITDVAARDQALAKVAWFGAQAGDGRAVLACLGAMSVSPVRDQAASQCSAQLAADGWGPQALAAAQMIGDSTVRDRALSKIAQTSPYPVSPP